MGVAGFGKGRALSPPHSDPGHSGRLLTGAYNTSP